MKVEIIKTQGWDVALADALWTVHKESEGKEPSEVWKAKACISEHSMLADVLQYCEDYIKDVSKVRKVQWVKE